MIFQIVTIICFGRAVESRNLGGPKISKEFYNILKEATPGLTVSDLVGTWKMRDHFAVESFEAVVSKEYHGDRCCNSLKHLATDMLNSSIKAVGVVDITVKTVKFKNGR